MQKITKVSQVVANDWYWVGNQILKTFKRGRWIYFKNAHWVGGETVQTVLSRPRLFGAIYGPIPRPPEAERGKD